MAQARSARALADGQVPLFGWSAGGAFTLQLLGLGLTIIKMKVELGRATTCGLGRMVPLLPSPMEGDESVQGGMFVIHSARQSS